MPGVREGRDGKYRWQMTTRPPPDDLVPQALQGNWALYEINVTVQWLAAQRFELTTYHFGHLP